MKDKIFFGGLRPHWILFDFALEEGIGITLWKKNHCEVLKVWANGCHTNAFIFLYISYQNGLEIANTVEFPGCSWQ